MNLISTINANWSIRRTSNCLTKALVPGGLSDPQQWSLPILQVLAEISALSGVDRSDFRGKLEEAIKARQARNKSTVGTVRYMTVVDLRAVLRRYKEEEKEIEAKESASPPAQAQAKGKDRATRSKKDIIAEEQVLPANQPKPRGRPRKIPILVPRTPIRPIGEDDDEEEEEEDSDALLAHGKYQYLERVHPVRVNLNPDASVAAKPPQKKPALRAKAAPRGQKRIRNQDEDELPDPRAAKRPSVVHEDPDPRVPDDTGFLSPLVATPMREKKKGKGEGKRLSRLQEIRVREPHWQQPVVEAESIPVQDGEVEEEDVVMDEAPVSEEDAGLEEVLRNLEQIPNNATIAEKLEMEELRLSMERRVWRIKVLRIQRRTGTTNGEETARGANSKGPDTSNARRSGRTLRTHNGKK
jgi:hypothetical protein